jgi:NAD(P)-dependent dehydrogenase (short-subunit alcohol dehydrogenase family)
MRAREVAIVTGGSGGIGRACAEALVGRGYDVVIAARGAAALKATAKVLECRSVAADCSVEEDVERLFTEAGPPKVLVHAAGGLEGTKVKDQSPAVFERMFRANLLSAYLVTHAALQTMAPGSRIFFISSVAGMKGLRGLSAYSASKAGLVALAQSVADEVEADGIGVHIVTPGPVRTAMIGPGQGFRQWPLECEDVGAVISWLDSLPPRVVVREIVMRSTSKGPFAPEPFDA